MRTRRFGGTLVAMLALLGTGCSAGGAGTDAVAWTDEVCGALTGFTLAATRQPRVDRTDPAAAVRGVGDYLASTSSALQQSIAALDEVGPSPVDGGDEYVGRLQDALIHIRTSFDTAGTQLSTVDASSPAALATALPAAVAPLQELHDMPSPTEGLRANDELRTASEQAPNCRELRSASSPAG
jgi:hypothetical protein